MGIYVVGMHRSGTSVLARTVGLLTGYEGHRGAAHDNLEGHWELPETNRVLDEALLSVDADWVSPPLTPLDPSDARITSSVEKLQGIIKDLGPSDWVLKDPRVCLALDVVLAAAQEPPIAIATHRNPAEVGASIHARDGYSQPYGVAVWEVYTNLMVQQLRAAAIPTFWVSYEQLMTDPSSTVERLADFLRSNGRTVEPAAIAQAAAAVVPSLRNQTRARDDVELLPNQQRLLHQLADAVENGRYPDEPTPPISPWSAALIDCRRPFIRMETDNRYLTRRLALVRPLFRGFDRWRRMTGRRAPLDPFENYV